MKDPGVPKIATPIRALTLYWPCPTRHCNAWFDCWERRRKCGRYRVDPDKSECALFYLGKFDLEPRNERELGLLILF